MEASAILVLECVQTHILFGRFHLHCTEITLQNNQKHITIAPPPKRLVILGNGRVVFIKLYMYYLKITLTITDDSVKKGAGVDGFTLRIHSYVNFYSLFGPRTFQRTSYVPILDYLLNTHCFTAMSAQQTHTLTHLYSHIYSKHKFCSKNHP